MVLQSTVYKFTALSTTARAFSSRLQENRAFNKEHSCKIYTYQYNVYSFTLGPLSKTKRLSFR